MLICLLGSRAPMFESTYAVFHLPWKSELGMTSHTRRSSSQVGKPRSASHCLQPARLAIVTPVDLKKKKNALCGICSY